LLIAETFYNMHLPTYHCKYSKDLMQCMTAEHKPTAVLKIFVFVGGIKKCRGNSWLLCRMPSIVYYIELRLRPSLQQKAHHISHLILQKNAHLLRRPPWADLHLIWHSRSSRWPNHPWQFFGNRLRGFDSVRGRILAFPGICLTVILLYKDSYLA